MQFTLPGVQFRASSIISAVAVCISVLMLTQRPRGAVTASTLAEFQPASLVAGAGQEQKTVFLSCGAKS